MDTVDGKPSVLLIGGTVRAVATLRSLVARRDIAVPLAIFMPGYPDEQPCLEELEEIASAAGVPSIAADRMTDEIIARCEALRLDAIVGLGVWRSMLPGRFLATAPHGFLAVHGTPLPKYRGWAGIYWQIINGDPSVTLRAYRLGDGLDDGPIICDGAGARIEASIDLENELHVGEILEQYNASHVILTNRIADALVSGEITYRDQDESAATFSCHRGPEDGEIRWSDTTRAVFDFVRAQSRPLAGAYTYYDGRRVTLWRVRPRYDYASYTGRIVGKVVTRDADSGHVVILTGDGGLEVIEAEAEGDAGVTRPTQVFTSVRDDCKSRVEALVDRLDDPRVGPQHDPRHS